MANDLPAKRHPEKGFSLLELLIVVAIIVIMAAVALPNIGNFIRNYRIRGAAQSVASTLQSARGKAIAVWCSEDRVSAWHALMWRDEALAAPDCAHPVDRNIELGERLGVNGTPTLVAADGRVLPGAASLAQIDAWLGRTTAGAFAPAPAGNLPK